MTLLTPIQGELIIALFTILFGIAIEKWYVSKSSIAMNVTTWFVLLFTINVGTWVFVVFGLWLTLGFTLTFIRGLGGVKQLFGSKVFGTASLFLGLYKLGYLHLNGILTWVGFIAMVCVVFVFGHLLADNDDRNNEWY